MEINAWNILIALLQIACLVQGDAILEVQMVSYKNSGGRDWRNKRCDPKRLFGGKTKCDQQFKFCFDKSSGDSNADSCYYKKAATDKFKDANDIVFDHDMASVANPIKVTVPTWLGSIRFKVEVTDNDKFNKDDLVDKIDLVWSLTPARSLDLATWSQRHVVGIRPKSPTSLTLNLRLYCARNYYNSRCEQYCSATNGSKQHYTCDPDTGDKVCRPGWESHTCDVVSDDCLENECSNNSTCQDGYRAYTCRCHDGFTGERCETNIDDCVSSPCQNGGRCVDMINGYKCICTHAFVGVQCSQSVCDEGISPCMNGGSCYIRGGSPRCLCPPAFAGDDCEQNKCDTISCDNGGTCEGGRCICTSGYIGHRCETSLCVLMECLNGATCYDGVCRCVSGYTGRYCQSQLNECVSNPCQNEGTCRSKVNGYSCSCLPAYTGMHCENVIQPLLPVVWHHLITPDGTAVLMPASAASLEETNTQLVPVWALVIIVVLLVIIIVIAIAAVLARRRYTRKASTMDTSIEFRVGPDGEGTVTGITNPHCHDAVTLGDTSLCSGCQGEAPPPYTLTPRSDTKSCLGHDADSDNTTNELFDSPPLDGAAAAEATELPIKSALCQAEGID